MHKSELLISGITAKTRDCNSRIHRTGKCSMGRLRKLVLPACFLFTNMFAHATVHGGAIHITVLDSETHSVILDGSGVPKNCDGVSFDAYCFNSKTTEVTNSLLVQEVSLLSKSLAAWIQSGRDAPRCPRARASRREKRSAGSSCTTLMTRASYANSSTPTPAKNRKAVHRKPLPPLLLLAAAQTPLRFLLRTRLPVSLRPRIRQRIPAHRRKVSSATSVRLPQEPTLRSTGSM